jgi:hypothetical protein
MQVGLVGVAARGGDLGGRPSHGEQVGRVVETDQPGGVLRGDAELRT